jgi:hypothetical protein
VAFIWNGTEFITSLPSSKPDFYCGIARSLPLEFGQYFHLDFWELAAVSLWRRVNLQSGDHAMPRGMAANLSVGSGRLKSSGFEFFFGRSINSAFKVCL